MNFDHASLSREIDRLRTSLPVSGYPRPALLAELRSRKAAGRSAPKLRVIDILDAGSDKGLMCRFLVVDKDARSFVAPISQIALDRRHPMAQAVATHCNTTRSGTA